LRQQDDATREYNEVLSQSIFSLCPEGAGPNTLRFWESLAVGSVPVLFHNSLVLPPLGESRKWEHGIVYYDGEIEGLTTFLDSFTLDELKKRSRLCMEFYGQIRSYACL
jgi:hypothetical protein